MSVSNSESALHSNGIRTLNTRGDHDTKATTLKLTGTSRFSALSTRKNGDKTVLVQKDIEVKALVEKQSITLIYATNGEEHVFLTPVVEAE